MKKQHILSVFSLFMVVSLLETLSRSGVVHPLLIPPPTKVLTALGRMLLEGSFWSDVQASLSRQFVGLCVGVVLGSLCGLICGRSAICRALLNPLIQPLRPIPAVALVPFIMVCFGLDNTSKIVSVSIGVFFPVWLNTYIGAASIPQMLLWHARLLTNSSYRLFQKVVFPATLPFITAGIRTGIAISFIMVFVSENTAGSDGLGYRISMMVAVLRTDEAMAGLVVLGTLGALSDYLFTRGAHFVFPWLRLSQNGA